MTVPVRGIEESGFFTDPSLNVADPSPTKVQILTFFIIWKSEPEVRSWVAGGGGGTGFLETHRSFLLSLLCSSFSEQDQSCEAKVTV